jgi:hypothetical protein
MKSKDQKREEAKTRNAAWDALSLERQMADLDRRLGKGQGAKRQRERLIALIESRADAA